MVSLFFVTLLINEVSMQTQGQFFHMLWVKCMLQEPTMKKTLPHPAHKTQNTPKEKGLKECPKVRIFLCILSTYTSSHGLLHLVFLWKKNNYGKTHKYTFCSLGRRYARSCGNSGSFGFQHILWSKVGASRSLQCKRYL